jgi:hypothetical protein
LPRKKYEKRIIPYMQAYPLLDSEKTFDSMKKEAARFVGTLEKWMDDQIENGDRDEVEIWIETLFPQIRKAKTLRSRIYTSNKKIAKLEIDIEIARVTGNQEQYDALREEKFEEEAVIAGTFWRIYRAYALIRPQITLGQTDKREEEYEEFQMDLEKVGTV